MRAITASLTLSAILGCSAVGPTGGGGYADPDAAAPVDIGAPRDVPAPQDLPGASDVPAARDVPAAPDAGPTSADDPAARSAESVCARWTAESAPARAAAGWTSGPGNCDPGTLPTPTRTAALQALNLFRWLAGLNPVGESAPRHEAAPACAVRLERNGMLSHTPPMTWTCWSPLGYEGTSRGNLIGGRGTTANAWNSIDRLIDDRNDLTRTLGHRRWMLYPPLGDVGYGQSSGFACLYVLGGFGTRRARPWVAWPNAGPVPAVAVPPSWSFSAPGLGWRDGASSVTVTRDGAPVAVTPALRAANYGDDTVSWDVPAVTPGAVYAVELRGIAAGTVRYEVRPVACP